MDNHILIHVFDLTHFFANNEHRLSFCVENLSVHYFLQKTTFCTKQTPKGQVLHLSISEKLTVEFLASLTMALIDSTPLLELEKCLSRTPEMAWRGGVPFANCQIKIFFCVKGPIFWNNTYRL